MYQGKPLYTQKFFNKKFKGNFAKSKAYVIAEAHKGYNNSVESIMEEDLMAM